MIGAQSARLWINAGLGIAVIGLAIWVYLAQQEPEDSADPLTTVERAEVERIVLRPVVGEAIKIARADYGWEVVEPIQAPADQSIVDSLLSVLSAPALSRYPEKSLKLSDVGLAPPQLWLDFSGVRIALGAVNPLNFRRYAMYEGRVALTQDRYAEFIEAAPIDYVSRAPVPYPTRLNRLEVPNYHLKRDPQGDWQQSDEIKDQEAADAVVNAWKSANAVALSQTVETEALDEAILGFEGDQEVRLLVIAREPELVLARPDLGLAYHFDPTQAEDLFPPAPSPPEPEDQSPEGEAPEDESDASVDETDGDRAANAADGAEAASAGEQGAANPPETPVATDPAAGTTN